MENANRQFIAGALEKKGVELLKIDAEEIKGSFLQADRIRISNFAEAMIFLLRARNGIEPDYSKFAYDCREYFGVSMDAIPEEEVKQLFDRFLNLLEDSY